MELPGELDQGKRFSQRQKKPDFSNAVEGRGRGI